MPESSTLSAACARTEEENLADRYVLGQLTPEQAEAFEDHYMTCPTCVAEVERAELMVGGLKRVAAESLSEGLEADEPASSEPAEEKQAAPESHAGTESRDNVVRFESPRPQNRSRWPQVGGWLAAALVGAVLTLPLTMNRTETPGGAAQVFHMQPVRSAQSAPEHRIALGETALIVALEISPPFFPIYRATLESEGQFFWSSGQLELGDRDTVSLELPRSRLSPGDYTLMLEGAEAPGERWVDVGRFTFRAVAP